MYESDVFRMANISIAVFGDVKAFNAVDKYRHFGQTCYHRLTERGENRGDVRRVARERGTS